MLYCYSLIDPLPNFTAIVVVLKQWLIPANTETIPQKVKTIARPRRKLWNFIKSVPILR
jgi:hypothetical protein